MVDLPLFGRKGTLAASAGKLRATSYPVEPVANEHFSQFSPVSSSSPVPLLVHPTPCWAGTAASASRPTLCTAYSTLSPLNSSPPRIAVLVTPSLPPRTGFSESCLPSLRCTPISRPQSRFISLEPCSSFLGASPFFCRSSLEERRRCNDDEICPSSNDFIFYPPYLTFLVVYTSR